MTTTLDAIAGVTNACQALEHVVTGGQPTASHLHALKAAGVDLVLDLRAPTEPRPMDETKTLAELGIEYVVVPVTPETMNDATLDRVRQVLRDAEAAKKQVFFHCGSGSRVGGALYAHLILDCGFDADDAELAAMRCGLRSAELLEWAQDYVRRKRG